MQGILGEIIRDIVTHQPDMQVVGELAESGEFVSAPRRGRSDVVILGLGEEAELPAACLDLLEAFPGVAILALSGNGRQAYIYRLRPERVSVGQVSAASLTDAIRSSVRPRSSSLPP